MSESEKLRKAERGLHDADSKYVGCVSLLPRVVFVCEALRWPHPLYCRAPLTLAANGLGRARIFIVRCNRNDQIMLKMMEMRMDKEELQMKNGNVPFLFGGSVSPVRVAIRLALRLLKVARVCWTRWRGQVFDSLYRVLRP